MEDMHMTEIRLAAESDVAAIAVIGHITWSATYWFASADYVRTGLDRWWSREALLASMRDTTVLVATDGDEAVGVGNIDLRGETPVIWKLCVLPHAQGTGVGSALMAALLGKAPVGAPVRLQYVEGNERAAAFYATKGFTIVGREAGEQPGWPRSVWVERGSALID